MKNINLVHHWLTDHRGGEKVLEQFCLLFHNADIYTLIKTKKFSNTESIINKHRTYTSFLNYIPYKEKVYKYF